jgi:hypothetical protein
LLPCQFRDQGARKISGTIEIDRDWFKEFIGKRRGACLDPL